MNQGQSGWLLLFLLAICLMVIGISGNLGTTIGILFCPTYVTIDQDGNQWQ